MNYICRTLFSLLCCLSTAAIATPIINETQDYLGVSGYREIPRLNGYISYDVEAQSTPSGLEQGIIDGAVAKVKWDMNRPHSIEASAYTGAVIDNLANTHFLHAWSSAGGNMSFDVSLKRKDGSAGDLDELVPVFADWFVYSQMIMDLHDSSRHYGRSIASVSISNAYGGAGATVQDFTGTGAYKSGKDKLFLSANAPLRVDLSAFADSRLLSYYPLDYGSLSGKTTAGVAGGYAFADPNFYIDPAWEFADLYELYFETNLKDELQAQRGDAGLTSLYSVTEPAPFALFLTSLFILVLVRRSFLTTN